MLNDRLVVIEGQQVWQPPRHSKRMFTKEEDNKIISLVHKLGAKDWKSVSKHMRNRSPRQCRERWRYYLSPNVGNGPWTEDEDQLLLELIKTMEGKWSQIALYFTDRTCTNVKNRYKLLKRSTHKKELYGQKKEATSSDLSEQTASPDTTKEVRPVQASNSDGEKQNNSDSSKMPINLDCQSMSTFWEQNQWFPSDDCNFGWL